MKKGGFTLIELMIVVAIIAIIAAIAIPNLLTSRISANETNACGGLRTLIACESTWRQQDSDGNGKQDFWGYDVSCFYRMFRADGLTRVEAIDIAFAKADRMPALVATLGATIISADLTLTSKAGYYYGALSGYTVNDLNRPAIPSGNLVGSDFTFAFAAAPQVYGTSGVRIFIVNQAGVIYGLDPATVAVTGDANKWSVGVGAGTGLPGSTPLLGTGVWPGADPSSVGHDGVVATVPHWAIVQ